MEKNFCKKRVLMAFMQEGMLLPSVLKTVTDQEGYVQKLISKMVSEGLLSKRYVAGRSNGHEWKLSYRRITPKGVQWLIDNCSEEYPWLKYIPTPVPCFSVSQDMSSQRLARFLKSVSASILFSNYGIPTEQYKSIERTVTDKNKWITFRALKDAAMDKYEKLHGKLPEAVSDEKPLKRYYHSRDFKNIFSLSESEVKQYLFSAHIGLLINRSHSYLIYYADVGGPLFRKHVIERVRTALRRYIRTNNLTNEGFEVCERGIVLCRNSKDFESMFRLNHELLRNRIGIGEVNRRICDVFKSLYAVPLTALSVYALDDILHYEDNLENITVERLIRFDPGFKKTNVRITPMTYNGIKVYLGTAMELGSMQRFLVETVSERNRNEKYMIVCYRYQEEYYRRIFPDSLCYYHVTDEILHAMDEII